VHVERGQVGQGAAAGVLELDPAGAFGSWWQVVMAAAQGLELGLLIGADHVVDHVLVGSQPSPLPAPVIQLEHAFGPGGEVAITREDPQPVRAARA